MSACPILVVLISLLPNAGAVAAPADARVRSAAEYSRTYGGQTFVVLFDGGIHWEQYDNGGAADKPQGLVSGCKSFVGAAAVAAVQDGLIRFDDPACNSIAEWQDDPVKKTVTYRQLLNMTSGLAPVQREKSAPWPAWKEIAANSMAARPGERFEYGAYHLNTFAYALEKELGQETFEDFLNRRVLDAIGAKVEWRLRCEDGRPQVGGGAVMTARDWGAFGELIRRGGNWNGRQVLDRELLSECFRGTEQNPAYGLTWWLAAPVSDELVDTIPILSQEWGEVANCEWLPDDLVAAFGGGKQRLFVIPSLKLVVVRQGSQSQGFSEIEFLSLLLRGMSAGDSSPSPASD